MVAWLGLLVSGVIVYWGSVYLGVMYDFDDMEYIFRNPYTDGLNWSNIKGAFSEPFIGNYAPLHILSYALEYYLWPYNPEGYHATNVLLHLINAILLYSFVRQLTDSERKGFLAAMIFLLHPVQVESVAWLSERKNLLSSTFFWGVLLFYLRVFPPQVPEEHTSGKRRTGLSYALSILFFAMALLTKSSVVVVPVLLVLYHLFFTQSVRWTRVLLSVAPFVLLSLVFSVLTMVTQSGSIIGLYGDSILGHVYMMLFVLGKYIRLLLFPINLSFQYDVPPWDAGGILSSAAPFLCLALFLGAAATIFWNRSRLSFWVLWFLVCLLPVSQIVPMVTYMNDRYLYLPMVGFAALVAAGLDKLYSDRSKRFVSLAGAAGTILVLGVLTIDRIPVWLSPRVLWEDAQRKAPENHLVHTKVGAYLFNDGAYERALEAFKTSNQLRPKYYNYEWLGHVYGKRKEWREAIYYYGMCLQESPRNAKAWRNLGIALYNTKNQVAAIEALRKAVMLRPTYIRPYLDLAAIYEEANSREEERRIYEQMIDAMPDRVEGYLELSQYYARLKNREAAKAYLAAARQRAKKLPVKDRVKIEITATALNAEIGEQPLAGRP